MREPRAAATHTFASCRTRQATALGEVAVVLKGGPGGTIASRVLAKNGIASRGTPESAQQEVARRLIKDAG